MSDRHALIAAILANPDEDTPRLMFADWLDEHGEPARAEFIRVQCELARLRAAEADLPEAVKHGYYPNSEWPVAWRPQDTEKRTALFVRESELIAAHGAEWRAGLPKYANNEATRQGVSFRRGFVGHVMASLGPLTKSPAALWANHPVESILLAYSGGNDRRKVPKCVPLAALRELRTLDGDGNGSALAPYAECPHLSGLRQLRIGHQTITDDGAEALAGSPHLRPAALELACRALSARSLTRMLSAPFASRLRQFRPNGLPVGGADVLAGVRLGALRWLDLHNHPIADAGVETLTRSKHLTQLVTLDLRNTGLTDAALEALAAWPGLASVRVLSLGSNREITGRGTESILRSPHFRPLYIGLEWTGTGGAGARALAAWPGLSGLVGLDVSHAGLNETGAKSLVNSPHWRDVRLLKVWGNAGVAPGAVAQLRTRVGGPIDIWGW